MQQVSFSADNVTKEMQGLSVSGISTWSIFREE